MRMRERWLRAVHAALRACDPATCVAAGLRDATVAPLVDDGARRRFGVAIGKAALAMARGAGAVERGVIIVPARAARDGAPDASSPAQGARDEVPAGWRVIESAHPFVDERSVAAARAARDVIDAAGEGDVVLALISGGASALVEEPIAGLSIEELGARTREAMERGAPIAELNALRASLSRIKRGGLVATCAAPVVTLAVSDVIGDSLATIGSGPTIGTEPRTRDRVLVVAPMADLGVAAVRALVADAVAVTRTDEPLATAVAACAAIVGERVAALPSGEAVLWWGEPTLQVPADHGEGGRAQQLALHLAQALRGTDRAALVIGSDGVDGPPLAQRAAPAGAFVDGDTWDAIVRAGLDPERALARCDAGTVLAAVGALVVTGPTGINHGDLVIAGRAGPRVRPATEADLPAIAAMHRASIEQVCSAAYTPDQIRAWVGTRTLERYRALLVGKHMIVCEDATAILGFGVIDLVTGRVIAVYVAPDAVRGGVGRRLLRTLEAAARAAGIARLDLHATLNAERFYARQGFVSDGPTTVTLSNGTELASIKMSKSIS